jgi:hypothetical protein
MRKLIFKLLFLSIIVFLTITVLNEMYINNSSKYDYTGGILNDKHKIANKVSSPKVLIVGGSSGSFGINSEILKEQLHLPVVNMSFIAPLGTFFLLNDALKEVKKGDKIFVTIEYDINHVGYEEEILAAADYYPEAQKYLVNRENMFINLQDKISHEIKNVRQLVRNLVKPDFRKTANVSDKTSVYFRAAFSDNGDIISHLNNPPKKIAFQSFPTENIDFSEQIGDLNMFADKAKIKGADVFFIYPPIAESTFLYGKKSIHSIAQQLEKNIHCKVLGNVYDFVMPDSLFFDSFYHLNSKGRDVRTNKIIDFYNQK